MQVRTIASGSSGNCLLVSAGDCHVLVDVGISCRRLTTALASFGIPANDISAIFITHEHSDHISGLATLTKKFALPVYTSPGTARQLCYRMAGLDDLIHPMEPGSEAHIGPLTVSSFPTSHDAAQPMGFTLTCEGRKAAVATDLGYVSEEVYTALVGSHLVVCESNHDVDWLESGPYPYYLISRILSDRGHLSNEAGAALARRCVEAGAHTILLAHLSAENNTPARALSVAETTLRLGGFDPQRGVTVAVAPRSEPSPAYEV